MLFFVYTISARGGIARCSNIACYTMKIEPIETAEPVYLVTKCCHPIGIVNNLREMKLKAIVYNKTREFAGHTIPIEVADDATALQVKKAVEAATNVPSDIQWIVFGVQHFEDNAKLADIGIQSGYTIYSVPTYVEIPEIPNL